MNYYEKLNEMMQTKKSLQPRPVKRIVKKTSRRVLQPTLKDHLEYENKKLKQSMSIPVRRKIVKKQIHLEPEKRWFEQPSKPKISEDEKRKIENYEMWLQCAHDLEFAFRLSMEFSDDTYYTDEIEKISRFIAKHKKRWSIDRMIKYFSWKF
jgi:transposase